jgi:hypothetical protein
MRGLLDEYMQALGDVSGPAVGELWRVAGVCSAWRRDSSSSCATSRQAARKQDNVVRAVRLLSPTAHDRATHLCAGSISPP